MIEYTKLIIDFGLVVLVWVVQFAIYPSFQFYAVEDLKKWHPKYTLGISWVVAPLMLAQLGVAIYLATIHQSLFIIGNLALVIATWIITFVWAIPLHHAIDHQDELASELAQLLIVNRVRAFIWTVIFIWTVGVMIL
ncbi:hypothetical protein [Portibacter marinus]|uniref:hypothetical protein n=1 Tax=Portibacter marinus TaxID=2898660 RepID=UPI001F3373AC|nr:hypothetical protein [Portibacter marinus]